MPDRVQRLDECRIAVVIPAYRVEAHIADVLSSIPGYVRWIIVVDDASPDCTGQLAQAIADRDPRIVILRHERNQGVGGATLTGFCKAIEMGAEIIVKVDGDGQMPLDHLPDLVLPLVRGEADVSKGNRFSDLEALRHMPVLRRVGNTGLSFLAKAATGYWNCFDPTNGFLALRAEIVPKLPLDRVARTYFFEISLLGHLYLLGACVQDVPMPARYGSEVSSLSIGRVLLEFPFRLGALFVRRLVLRYGLSDFSMASLYLLAGLPLFLFGVVFGIIQWVRYAGLGVPTPTGTVMLATLPVILGFQLLLSAVGIDLQSVPGRPLTRPLVRAE
jgi:glycosyltransferase involved in cell wall biosynthesis